MRVWMHKITGEIAIARKIWLEEELPGTGFQLTITGMNIEYSAQNWAFENKHGVVMILPPKIEKFFEDLGEL